MRIIPEAVYNRFTMIGYSRASWIVVCALFTASAICPACSPAGESQVPPRSITLSPVKAATIITPLPTAVKTIPTPFVIQLEPTPTAAAPLMEDRLRVELDKVLTSGGDWHALVLDADGQKVYQYQAQTVIHPASTIKIAIAMLVLSMLEKQNPDLDQILTQGPLGAGRSYEQLLQAMLVKSEEDAAQILQDAVVEGLGWKEIDRLLAGWGAGNTKLVPRRSSAADICTLLYDLYRKSTPSLSSSRLILKYLAVKTPGDQGRLWLLAPLLPEGSVLYNKRGSLTDPVIVADTGVIDVHGEGPTYLCIFGYSTGAHRFEDLDKSIGAFALTWFQNREQH